MFGIFGKKKKREDLEHERHLKTLKLLSSNLECLRKIDNGSGQVFSATKITASNTEFLIEVVQSSFMDILSDNQKIKSQMTQEREQSQKEHEAMMGCIEALERKIGKLTKAQEA